MPYRDRRVTRYAVRDAETGQRLSRFYGNRRDARDAIRDWEHTGRVLEVYRTSQRLVTM